MHVALDRRHDDLAVGVPAIQSLLFLLLLHVRHQIGDGLLHHAGGFHHLRQEHASGAEQIADYVHAVHQRPFDHMQRALGLGPRLLDIRFNEIGNPVHERMGQSLLDRSLAPGEIGFLSLLAVAAIALGEHEQPLGGVGAAVEHHVLAGGAQLRLKIVVERDLPSIDDAHVHAGSDRVIEEHGVHGLAHGLVAAERERQVRHAA